jgi:ABC-type glycerol-3-phosphate transport system substrate-binding protein
MSDEVYARYAGIGGVIPATSSVAALPAYAEDEMLRVFVDQDMKSIRPFPRAQRAAEILGAYIERFCYGHFTIQETLDRAERDVNALLSVNRRS